MRKSYFTALVAFLFFSVECQAKVRLPHILGDNMVLQQDTNVRLWGWDTPGKKVTVTTSWDNTSVSAKTGNDGLWTVSVKTPKASYNPYTITFDDGEKTTLKDILFGEVWVCAGQSNMEMPMKGFDNCPVEGYNDYVIEAKQFHGIHYVKIPSVMSMRPLDDADCQWKAIDPSTIGDCSATGYFFARMVNKAIDVPIGLVMANKGGTRVESWLDAANLQRYTTESLDSMENVRKFSWDFLRPLVWGNGTFRPILNYTVKGILFYQGCSNVGDPKGQYTSRLKLLVEQWRRDFAQDDIPFYFVEICPYFNDDVNGDWGAKLREQQFNAQKVIPNSALVCTNDLVYPWETQQIHPCQKRQVGERLAYHALHRDYGMESILCESPSVKEWKFSGDTCYVQIQNHYNAISRYEDIQGFELAGADKVFHKAKARYYWTQGIIVTSPEVKEPVAVRYCFRNFQLGNVKNAAGLPLFPFRSDDW